MKIFSRIFERIFQHSLVQIDLRDLQIKTPEPCTNSTKSKITITMMINTEQSFHLTNHLK